VASLAEGGADSAAVHVEAAELSLEGSGYCVQDCALYKVSIMQYSTHVVL